MSAPPCSFRGCAKKTVDPTGRCPWHRSAPRPSHPVPPTTPTLTEWRSGFGVPHPTGGYDLHQTGNHVPLYEEFYRRGAELHRLDGPAVVTRTGKDGTVTTEEWWRHGVRTRTDGPAVRKFRYDGSLERETYYLDGNVHRENGPADIAYGPSGEIELETYNLNDALHRLDGPAWTRHRNQRGYEPRSEWWVHGVEYREREYARIREALDSGAPLEWAISYATGKST